jgi:hypothetical protein
MKIVVLSMLVGLAAGFVDILPMIIKKMDRRAIVSAFLQYFFVSIVIGLIDIPGVIWWLEGSLIALALSLPIVIIVSVNDVKAVPVILSMACILGALIGLAIHYMKGFAG